MSDHASGASPATQFHDVVVTNEQTRTRWRAGRAEIRRGDIWVTAGKPQPPAEFFEQLSSTYTITAHDAAGRNRIFASLTIDRAASDIPAVVVFR